MSSIWASVKISWLPRCAAADLMVAKLVGFSRSGVRDGQAALAALERDPTVELVVSDIVMPGGMSGLELARMLRQHRPGLPVLLATGYSQYAAQVVREAFALVEKPYHRDVLAASLRAAVERVSRRSVAEPVDPLLKRSVQSHCGRLLRSRGRPGV
jgi:two-component system NtrC family sensor kinase